VTDGQLACSRTGELSRTVNGFRLFDLKIVARVAQHSTGNPLAAPPVSGPERDHPSGRDRERKQRHQAAAISDHDGMPRELA
jgi:hypothetical protein